MESRGKSVQSGAKSLESEGVGKVRSEKSGVKRIKRWVETGERKGDSKCRRLRRLK